MKREIKFQIIYKNVISGYERLTEKNGNIFWQWMALDMNPDNGERWISGVYPKDFNYIRRQFTGLQDKNGKEIYESDIVKTGTDKLMVITWSNRFASFCIERDGWVFKHWFGEAFESTDCEIVGNIYQNPNLLQ